jgi:hypothetical protein
VLRICVRSFPVSNSRALPTASDGFCKRRPISDASELPRFIAKRSLLSSSSTSLARFIAMISLLSANSTSGCQFTTSAVSAAIRSGPAGIALMAR